MHEGTTSHSKRPLSPTFTGNGHFVNRRRLEEPGENKHATSLIPSPEGSAKFDSGTWMPCPVMSPPLG
jgi:hypothetical protein